ncbi:HTTM domain-containing protein [Candidatus Peregrinibacteria bacterium]|nr:HTTM domain-containing protein [Candidatus Peregrinibacteria bacterium]
MPPHPLALMRIAFGSFLLLYWGLKIPQVPMLFSGHGLILPLFPAHEFGPLASLFPPTVTIACILFAIFYASLLLFTVGFGMRIAGIVAFILNVYYWMLSLHLFNTSFERLFLFTLLVLTLSGADRTLSFRAWREKGDARSFSPVSILPQRLLALQITFVYLGVALQKLWLPDWQSGEILSYSLVGVWGSRAGNWIVARNLPLAVFDVSVSLIKAFELAMPFGLWVPRSRLWFMAGGALFHTGIALLLDIWWFLVLIPAYILFFDPEDVRLRTQRWLGKENNN